MRVLCLEFPTLAINLVRNARPHLTERPLVLLAGTGGDAVVTAVSPAVASRGVAPGMRAADARSLCATAMFLPDNAGDCVDELERIATIIRKYATLSVAIASSTRLMIDFTNTHDEQREAQRLLSLAHQWSRLDVRGGIGSSCDLAASAATHCRRGVAIDTRPALCSEPPVSSFQPVTGRVTLDADSTTTRRRLHGLVARLDALQEAYGQSCREVKLRAVGDDLTFVRTLRFERPIRASEARDRIEGAVAALPNPAGTVLEVELARPAPASAAAPAMTRLATAV